MNSTGHEAIAEIRIPESVFDEFCFRVATIGLADIADGSVTFDNNNYADFGLDEHTTNAIQLTLFWLRKNISNPSYYSDSKLQLKRLDIINDALWNALIDKTHFTTESMGQVATTAAFYSDTIAGSPQSRRSKRFNLLSTVARVKDTYAPSWLMKERADDPYDPVMAERTKRAKQAVKAYFR